MKKRLLTIAALLAMAVTLSAQSIFRPVPEDLFSSGDKAVNSAWLWRLSASVTAIEYTYNTDTKSFDSQPLSSAGAAIGYRHFSKLSDGTPYNDFGVNLALLLGTDITQISPASIKAALLINAFEFVNVGASYNISDNKVGILIGGMINF